uniref:Cilia- and flagella-associated protein 58 n=1 Tax=Glossina pallidipes TaxID=7398 RepID=A0A1A9ZZ70_GLOPL
MDENENSKASGSEDEPLVPDIIDDEFYKQLVNRVPEITKTLRQKDSQSSADNIQKLYICCNRYRINYNLERVKCQDLEEKIDGLNGRLHEAQELNELNQATITELKRVIVWAETCGICFRGLCDLLHNLFRHKSALNDKIECRFINFQETIWRQKDAAHLREQAAQEELTRLKETTEQLQESLKTLSDTRAALRQKRDETKIREKLETEIRDLTKRLQIQRSYTTDLEIANKTMEEKNKGLIKSLDETSGETYQHKKRIDVLTKDLELLQGEELKYREQIATFKQQNEKLTKMKVRQNLQILSLKTNMEHLNTVYNGVCNKLAKITVDYEYALQERDKYKMDLNQKKNLLKVREEEIVKCKHENSKLSKLQDNASRKHTALDKSKKEFEQQNLRLKTQLSTQDKEIEATRRVLQQLERNNYQLTNERDNLKRDLLLQHKCNEESQKAVNEAHYEIRSLKDTQLLQERKYSRLLDEVMQLNAAKAKKSEETQNLFDKIDSLQSEIQIHKSYELELKRTISDIENHCAKLQTQHNTLASDNHALQRNIQALSEEKTKLKTCLENLQNTNESLKAKLKHRDSETSKLQVQIDKMEKERRLLKTELRGAKLSEQHIKEEFLEKIKENDNYAKMQQQDLKTVDRLKRESDALVNEKNFVHSELSKREENCNQLNVKIKNLQKSHDQLQNEVVYYQDEMNLMRTEIKNLITERDVLRKDREVAADLRQEVLQMHRLLNQERIKARAFQEEMLTPMNVHRWRSLKGKDPEKSDLIQQIQSLRKQLLSRNIAALRQNTALRESQTLYDALKEFMSKLPSIKIKEELNRVKAALSRKDRKLKSLMAEINAKRVEEKSKDQEIEGLKINLTKLKQQLLEERKCNERQALMQVQVECLSAPPQLETHLTNNEALKNRTMI